MTNHDAAPSSEPGAEVTQEAGSTFAVDPAYAAEVLGEVAVDFLKTNGVEIGDDVRQTGTPEGLPFGSEYSEGEYATNNGWANFKAGGLMRAIYVTPEVESRLEAAGFKKIDAGVIDNNPDRFHAGMDSSALTSMAEQVGVARQQERNRDEVDLTNEAYRDKYGAEKPE